MASELINELQDIACYAEGMKSQIEILKRRYPEDVEKVRKCVEDMNRSLNKIARKCDHIYFSLPQEAPYENFYVVEPSMVIEQESGIYHFTLSHLLPHRICYDSSDNRLKYKYDKDFYYSGYRAAVEEYLKNNEVKMFLEPALIAFVHCYGGCTKLIDYDNLHTKTFIDASTKGIFVKDDSPAYLQLYHCAQPILKGEPHTEVYLGPVAKVLDRLEKMGGKIV